MAVVRASIALSWPKTTVFKEISKLLKISASVFDILLGGILAILAITFSISLIPIVFFLSFSGSIICAAPASSITSIALSGNFLSCICFTERSIDAWIASLVYFVS